MREFDPERVILFGSYAHGIPRPESDVDLLVVMSYAGSSGRASVEVLQRVGPPFGVDVIVRSPDEMSERLGMGDLFLKEIVSKGRVLYEADHARGG